MRVNGSAIAARPRAVVHLDLDGARHIYALHGWHYPERHDLLFEAGLKRALELFRRAGIHATLFVIAEDLDDPRKRELLQKAVAQGHEIASHTVTHRRLGTLSTDEKRREIFESRERLAAGLNVEIRGFRAPGFDIDWESLDLIHAAGYAYDSSLFSGHPGVSSPILELALPFYRPLPFPFHPSYSLALGPWYFRMGLRRFRRTGAPLVMLFHLADLEPLPHRSLRGWRAQIYARPHTDRESRMHACRTMLDLVCRQYRVVETRELEREMMRTK